MGVEIEVLKLKYLVKVGFWYTDDLNPCSVQYRCLVINASSWNHLAVAGSIPTTVKIRKNACYSWTLVPGHVNRIRTSPLWIKWSVQLKVYVGSQVEYETPEEDRRTHWLKHCEYNNKDEDNNLNTISDKDNQASSQEFRQVLLDAFCIVKV